MRKHALTRIACLILAGLALLAVASVTAGCTTYEFRPVDAQPKTVAPVTYLKGDIVAVELVQRGNTYHSILYLICNRANGGAQQVEVANIFTSVESYNIVQWNLTLEPTEDPSVFRVIRMEAIR